MQQIDIVFVNPPIQWGQHRMDLKPPLNLLYLASYLNDKGFSCRVIDVVSSPASLTEVVREISQLAPVYVGLPFYQGTFQISLELCRELKRANETVKIIGGGPMMTTSAAYLLKFEELDLGVMGEGELTMEELLTKGLGNIGNIEGLAFRNGDQVIETPRRKHLENLDQLPFVDFSLINTRAYLEFQASLEMPKWLFLSTSRGCTFRCVFCATPVLWPGKIRRMSVGRLMKELTHQQDLFPDANIGFMDDSFFSDKNWLKEFLDEIGKLKIMYCAIGRADHLEADEIKRLAATGCHYIALGVETGNQGKQKQIKKYLDLEKVKTNVRLLAQNNILSKCFFMLGFPTETPEEMVETINFAIECKRLGMNEANFFPVSIYPGTELSEGLEVDLFKSTVYQQFDFDNKSVDSFATEEERAEKRLSIYANIPEADINSFLTQKQLLQLIRLAYMKLDRMEDIAVGEIEAIRRT